MQWPSLQPNEPNEPIPKIFSRAYEMQLCLHNKKSQWLKDNVRYHYVETRIIYYIHAHGSSAWWGF